MRPVEGIAYEAIGGHKNKTGNKKCDFVIKLFFKVFECFYNQTLIYLYSMRISEMQLYNALKQKLGDNEAQQLVDFGKSKVSSEFNDRKDTFLTKEDKIDIMRSIYIVGIVQFFSYCEFSFSDYEFYV